MDARLERTWHDAPPRRSTNETSIADHLGLVRRIARHVHARISSTIEVEDLVQIGTVALIEAARTFEDRGEATFATYAAIRIRGSMIDALRKSATMVRSAMRRRREIAAARAALEASLGRQASETEMAAALELTLDAYRQTLASTDPVRHEPIDDVYSDQNAWFADATPDAYDVLARERLKAAIAAAVGALPAREAMVLQLYYVEELTLEDIGATLGIGAARVCQIKKAALAKVRFRLAGWDS